MNEGRRNNEKERKKARKKERKKEGRNEEEMTRKKERKKERKNEGMKEGMKEGTNERTKKGKNEKKERRKDDTYYRIPNTRYAVVVLLLGITSITQPDYPARDLLTVASLSVCLPSLSAPGREDPPAGPANYTAQ